jgi:hypothetical protein
MNDENLQIKISAEIHNNCLCLTYMLDSDLIIKEKKLDNFDPSKENIKMYYFWWMLNAFKPLFSEMPVENIQIEFTQECKDKFFQMLSFCYKVLKNTNEAVRQCIEDKNCARGNDRILFFDVGENVNFKKIYDRGVELDNKKTLYLNFDPGFNPVERKWEKTAPPMSVEEFVRYIKDNRIGKIVSINHYLLEKYLDQGVYILAVFQFLGIDYIIIDLDHYDLVPQGYLYKKFYNTGNHRRFSYAQFHVFWDEYYGLTNVSRIGFPHENRRGFSFQKLDDDYKIVVMSNSRINDILSMLNPIVFMLDQFRADTFFAEFCMWYYSLRHMILYSMDLTEFERLNFNALLLRFAYNASQFIKYIIIDSIKTDRKLEIYGDTGWKNVFPDHYVTYLDRPGIDRELSCGHTLNLLMNWQLTWLETSAVIFEALNYRVPFINHPAVVKTPELGAMSKIEYKNQADLNSRLDNIKAFLDNELVQSVNYLNTLLNDNLEYIVSGIYRAENSSVINTAITREMAMHDKLLQEKINTYIVENNVFLRYSFKSLFVEPVQYDMRQSRYFSRPFMQRLLHYAQNR